MNEHRPYPIFWDDQLGWLPFRKLLSPDLSVDVKQVRRFSVGWVKEAEEKEGTNVENSELSFESNEENSGRILAVT